LEKKRICYAKIKFLSHSGLTQNGKKDRTKTKESEDKTKVCEQAVGLLRMNLRKFARDQVGQNLAWKPYREQPLPLHILPGKWLVFGHWFLFTTQDFLN
jgi:hypothetical protein